MERDVEGNAANIGHDPRGSLWGWRDGLGEQTERFQFWMEVYPGMSPGSWIRRVPTVKGIGEDARLPQGGRRGLSCRGDGAGRAGASGDTLCVLEPP